MPKSAAIILSRQHLRPSLSDGWVRMLSEAVKFVKRENLTLVSSVGSNNWEIITACAALNKVPLRLVLPARESSSFEALKSKASRHFCLTDSRVKFDKINDEISSDSTSGQLANIRDESIVEQADILIPVSIRPNGNMSLLLSKSSAEGKSIVREFETEYEKKEIRLAYQIDVSTLSNEIKSLEDSYLIHWTRATNAPWPDENKLEFYKMILNSGDYRRTAYDTMCNILRGKSIIASSRNMPSNVKTVCFSGLIPKEAIRLMKWRARYCQMSFEPFGIGIERNCAIAHGVKKVRYYDLSHAKQIDGQDSWLWQSTGKKTDWRNEKEFRHKGNFDFAKIPEEKRIIFCHYKRQASLIQNQTGLRALSFYN